MKLYLTGSVASGKSTLARQIAARTGIPCHSLDEVVYVPDPGAPSGTGNARKRSGTRSLRRSSASPIM